MTHPIKWPPIPKVVKDGQHADIIVQRPYTVKDDNGDPAEGVWMASKRTILIERGLKRERAWWVLFHEQTHATLDDSGVACMLSAKQEEAVCTAIATARLADLRQWIQQRNRNA